MTNFQIILQFLGWGLLIYLHNRTLRRAEIARLKESLIAQILEFSDWTINKLTTTEINHLGQWVTNKLISKKINPLKVELLLTAKTAQLDLKLLQLNQYSRIEILPPELFSSLRDIDTDELISNENIEIYITELTSELIEIIETRYADTLFNINYFRYLYLFRRPEILGALFGICLLSFIYHFLNIVIYHWL
jgi:hypothetical protein